MFLGVGSAKSVAYTLPSTEADLPITFLSQNEHFYEAKETTYQIDLNYPSAYHLADYVETWLVSS